MPAGDRAKTSLSSVSLSRSQRSRPYQKNSKVYEIKTKHWTHKGRSVSLEIAFRRSKSDHFRYSIVLPKNSVELKLRLDLRGRRSPEGLLVEKTEAFMPSIPPDKVMKIAKEDLIADIIEHYGVFNYESLTQTD